MTASIPRLGLGTWGRTGSQGLEAILTAIEIGYRHLDTAQTYDTEAVIGQAIERSALPRRDFFITTKIADTNLARRDFQLSLRASLDRLRVERVDLTLITGRPTRMQCRSTNTCPSSSAHETTA